MKIFESLTDAIKHAAENYTEENSNKIIVTSPKQFNVQLFLKDDKEYWGAEFLSEQGECKDLKKYYINESASNLYNNVINNKFTDINALEIAGRWYSNLDKYITKENEHKYEIIKS